MNEASYLVARMGETVFVRSCGLANMKNAPMLSAFLHEMLAQGVTVICIDLSACQGMDSTFMGVLVGISQTLAGTKGKIVVVNPTENNLRLLNMLGVSEVLPVIPHTSEPDIEFHALPARPGISQIERMELIRQAHHHLVSLNETNKQKFSAFLAALEQDLKRLSNRHP